MPGQLTGSETSNSRRASNPPSKSIHWVPGPSVNRPSNVSFRVCQKASLYTWIRDADSASDSPLPPRSQRPGAPVVYGQGYIQPGGAHRDPRISPAPASADAVIRVQLGVFAPEFPPELDGFGRHACLRGRDIRGHRCAKGSHRPSGAHLNAALLPKDERCAIVALGGSGVKNSAPISGRRQNGRGASRGGRRLGLLNCGTER